MAEVHKKNFDTPDEHMDFVTHGRSDRATVGGLQFSRVTLEPGWKWSESVKPLIGTETCMTRHVGYMMSGKMHIQFDDGTEADVGPGEIAVIPAGHDAWIVGDETAVWLEVAAG